MESSLPSTQNLDFCETAEGKNEAKSYKEMISTFPRVQRWSYYEGFWYHSMFLEGVMSAQDHFIPQSTDIFITSSPKTGTTWLKALTFAICTRSPLRAHQMPHDCVPVMEYHRAQNPMKRDCAVPLVSTHVPYSSLPKSVVSSCCKMIYICRDAKDAFVSLWHFIDEMERSRNLEPLSLEEAFELFCSGISGYGPYWDHVLGYWRASLEFPEKVLFLTYEEMKKDTAAHVKKLAEFMGCSFTLEEEEEGEVQKIVSMCSFDKLSNLEVNKNGTHSLDTLIAVKNSAFFRKGEIGDWKNNLTPEMGARLDDIMEQKLKGSGLKLPR
ncbi:flavonol sulfotransferase [Salix suchowensis]|nr:flavonol sulfotransferase [Salix suchowensis]